MIGRSVGRVNLSNYKQVQNEMCWANGFVKLNDNRNLRAQLRDLDRYKSLQLSWLSKSLKTTGVEDQINPNIRIRKSIFSKIPGISDKDSNEIRNSLRFHKILNSRFKFNKRINAAGINIQLPLKFEPYQNEIIDILLNPTIKSHKEFYGNPYSYYYQIIERRNLK